MDVSRETSIERKKGIGAEYEYKDPTNESFQRFCVGQAHWMGIVYHFLGQEFVKKCREEMFKFYPNFIKE